MYATVAQVAAGFRDLSPTEEAKCAALLEEAAVIIDVYNRDASADAKQLPQTTAEVPEYKSLPLPILFHRS